FAGAGTMCCELEKHGWTADCSDEIVTLATASLSRRDLSAAGALRAGRPPLILLDTVTTLLTSRAAPGFVRALRALNRIGDAVDAFVLDKRLFVLGRPAGGVESGELRESDVRPRKLVNFIRAYPRIRWSIRELPAYSLLPPIEWIAESYLNPLVNELIHGRLI